MISRRSLADEVDSIDQSIADLNESKRELFESYRNQLSAAGALKPAIKIEIEAAKAAIKRRRAVAKDEFAVEEKDALVEEIFHEITARAPRATRTREDSLSERAKARTSEAMADHKVMSADLAKHGLISAEAHAENIRLSDAIANKIGAGALPAHDSETGEIIEEELPETATRPGQDVQSPIQRLSALNP